MRELDEVLLNYLERVYPTAGADQQAAFRDLLDCPDPDVLAFVTGRSRPERKDLADVVNAVRTSYRH